MKDRAWLEAKREEIRQHKAKLLADYHAHCGAEQLCEQLLADDPPASGETDLSALTQAIAATQGDA